MKVSSVSPERWRRLPVAGPAADGHRFQGFGDGADLVELDQRRVARSRGDGAGDDGWVGAEVVVADELGTRRRGVRSARSTRRRHPRLARPRSLDRETRPAMLASGRSVAADVQFAGHLVPAVRLAESEAAGSRAMERPSVPGWYPASLMACTSRPQDVFRAAAISGAKPPSSPRPVDSLRAVSSRRSARVDLGSGADRLGQRRRAERGDHELLEVQLVGGVHAAVEHVEVRDRQRRVDLFRGQPPPQRDPRAGGQRPGRAIDTPTMALAPSLAFVRRAVQFDHGVVDLGQRLPGPAAQQPGQLAVDGADGAEDSLAFVPVRSPSRRSAASREPVDAPDGTPARAPCRRPAGCTARVGRARESRISSADDSATSKPVICLLLSWAEPGTGPTGRRRVAGAEAEIAAAARERAQIGPDS